MLSLLTTAYSGKSEKEVSLENTRVKTKIVNTINGDIEIPV
ncbi:hypothetical protein [Tissierella simiarum]|nr:hypothetical protein [Tissierella simiarum]